MIQVIVPIQNVRLVVRIVIKTYNVLCANMDIFYINNNVCHGINQKNKKIK